MIRPATLADLDAIMVLERRCFPADAWSVQTMEAELASRHGDYVVDTVDDDPSGEIVGYGGVRALRGQPDADIQTIAIAPEHRGAGRGRALLRTLLDAARIRGAREVFLEVRADNPAAQGLYATEGFIEIGRRPHYYQPDDVAAVVMKAPLRIRSAATPESAPAVPEENSASGGADPRMSPPEAASPSRTETTP